MKSSTTVAMLLAMILCLANAEESVAQRRLPRMLDNIAHEVGCHPIFDFYNSEGMVGPSFLWGYLPGSRERSAVFWCERDSDRAKLMVSVKDGVFSNSFVWDRHYPYGLWLANVRELDLGDFSYVDDPMTHGPRGVMTTHPPVESYWDGFGTLFYEYEGRWLFSMDFD